MRKQAGLSLIGTLIVGGLLAFLFLIGLRAVPAYTEYMAIKKDIANVVHDSDANTSISDMRRDFDKRADIDEIQTIRGADLNIAKSGGAAVISVDYERRIPLFANISLVISFSASSGG